MAGACVGSQVLTPAAPGCDSETHLLLLEAVLSHDDVRGHLRQLRVCWPLYRCRSGLLLDCRMALRLAGGHQSLQRRQHRCQACEHRQGRLRPSTWLEQQQKYSRGIGACFPVSCTCLCIHVCASKLLQHKAWCVQQQLEPLQATLQGCLQEQEEAVTLLAAPCRRLGFMSLFTRCAMQVNDVTAAALISHAHHASSRMSCASIQCSAWSDAAHTCCCQRGCSQQRTQPSHPVSLWHTHLLSSLLPCCTCVQARC